MKEKLIRRVFFASDYDLTALEEYLEDMAAKGLMLVNCSNNIYYFKECDPCKLYFTVDAFVKASIFNTLPNAEAQEYIAFCEEAGWHYITSNGRLLFFYAKTEHPIPVQTDDAIKLSLIHRHTLRTSGIAWAAILFIALSNILQYHSNLSDALIIFGNMTIFLCVMILLVLISATKYFTFYIRNKKRIKNGLGIKYNSGKSRLCFQFAYFVAVFFMFLFLILSSCVDHPFLGTCMFIAVVATFLICFYTESHKHGTRHLQKKEHLITAIARSFGVLCCCTILSFFLWIFHGFDQIVPHLDEKTHEFSVSFFSHDALPITMEQLGIDSTKYVDQSVTRFSSLFGSDASYYQYFYEADTQTTRDELEYEVVNSFWSPIIDSFVNNQLQMDDMKYRDITTDEGNLWDADKVYSVYDLDGQEEGRLVVYEHKAVVFHCTQAVYTKEHISLICKALGE